MSDWIDPLLAKFSSGQDPTEDELLKGISDAALERKNLRLALERVTAERDEAVAERDAAVATLSEMSLWMGRIVAAFLKRDADAMAQAVAGYTTKYVKFVKVDVGNTTRH